MGNENIKNGKEFKFKNPKTLNRCLKAIWDLRVCLTEDFVETETHFPIKHSILQNSRFQIHPGERNFQLKNTKTSLELGNIVATRANLPCFQSFANENENLSKPVKLPIFRIWESTKHNSVSVMSTVFRNGTNQTYPRIDLFQIQNQFEAKDKILCTARNLYLIYYVANPRTKVFHALLRLMHALGM